MAHLRLYGATHGIYLFLIKNKRIKSSHVLTSFSGGGQNMIYCKLYKALLVFLYFICFLAGANAETKNFGKNGEYTASLKVDREDGLYSVGEPCSFTLKITRENCAIANIPFRAEISKDGCAPIQKVSGKTDHLGEAHLSGKLDEAGFVRCTLTLSSEKNSFSCRRCL